MPFVSSALESRLEGRGWVRGNATCWGRSLEEDQFKWPQSCPSQKRQREAGREDGCGRGCGQLLGCWHSSSGNTWSLLAKNLTRFTLFFFGARRGARSCFQPSSVTDCCVTQRQSPLLSGSQSFPVHDLPACRAGSDLIG